MAKQIVFDEEVRHAIKKGIDALADAVRSPWAPRGTVWRWTRNGGLRR